MPPMFNDETFTAVLLMREDTQIEYLPEGKRPGSMSYTRYKGYCEAKTVGEALAMGSKPHDLCNDFEKKILKVVGGLRTEFLEYNSIDPTTLTPTDKAISTFRMTAYRLKMQASEGGPAPQEPRAQRRARPSAEPAAVAEAKGRADQLGDASQQQQQPSQPLEQSSSVTEQKKGKKGSEEKASKRQSSGMECSPEAKKGKRGMAQDSPEKAARPAKQQETPRAKKARTLATALQFMQRIGSSGEFRCLALALQKLSEEPTNEVPLTEYFQSLLSGTHAAHDLTLALELLGSSGPSSPALRAEAIQRAAGAAFQVSLPAGDAIAEAVLEARRSAPRTEGARAVTLEDVAAARFAGFDQGDGAVQVLADALRNSSGDGESREALHIARLLEGSGPELSVVFCALSRAMGLGSPEAAEAMERAAELAFSECGGLAGRLVDALLLRLQAPMLYKLCSLQLGQPVLPMIRAQVEEDCIEDALSRAAGAPTVLEELCAGCRVQVHKQGDDVCIFDMCHQDLAVSGRDRLVAGVRAALKGCSTCVLDGVLQKDGQDLRLVAFDCLWLNGRALLRRPLLERREALRRVLTRSDIVCMPAAQEFTLAGPPEGAMRSFLRAAAASGCKGVLLKRLDGVYEAGSVSSTWFGLSVAAEWQA